MTRIGLTQDQTLAFSAPLVLVRVWAQTSGSALTKVFDAAALEFAQDAPEFSETQRSSLAEPHIQAHGDQADL